MQQVHVSVFIERSSGPPHDATEAHAARWTERGYAVTKRPDDGLDHPLNRPCPICPTLEPAGG